MAKIKGQLEDAQVHNKSADPTNLPDGLIWLNTATNKLKAYVGAATRVLVTEDQTQTLTGKTVVAASNTITTAASGNLTSVELNAALAELQGDIDTRATSSSLTDHLNDAADAHDASAISSVPAGNLAASTVQTALDELQTDIDTRATSSALSTHISDATNPHAVTATQVGLGNVDNTSDATKNAAVAVLTNKDIDGGTASNSNRITLPKAAKTTLDALTRKQGTLLFDTTSNKPYYDDGTNLQLVGSGSGGAINLISNGDAEAGTTGWTTYTATGTFEPVDVDSGTDIITSASHGLYEGQPLNFTTAGVIPGGITVGTTYYAKTVTTNTFQLSTSLGGSTLDISGVGSGTQTWHAMTPGNYAGSPTTTWTTSSTTPLYGTNSYLLTKDAANRSGEGVYYGFTVSPAHMGKVVQISFDYILNSGTFTAGTSTTDSDVTVWIYDVSAGRLIQPTSFRLDANSSTISSRFTGTFQTSATSTSYRLHFHVATTSASAYVLKIDNVSVSPSTYVYGTPVTDWTSYTPTVSGFGTSPTVAGKWRRVGDSMELSVQVSVTNTAGAAALTFNLPSGYAADYTKSSSSTYMRVGFATYTNTGTGAIYQGSVFSNNTSTTTFVIYGDSGIAQWNATVPQAISTSAQINMLITVPIVGWSSSVQMSDQADTRVVAASLTTLPTTTVTAANSGVTTMKFTGTIKDTHGGWDSSTGLYTVKVPGLYLVSAYVGISPAATSTWAIGVYQNSTAKSWGIFHPSSVGSDHTFTSVTLDCVAGDTISLRPRLVSNTASVDVGFNSADRDNFSIVRVSGPSQIAASENIAASATLSTASHTSTGNWLDLPSTTWTDVTDSHGAMSSAGLFTAPIAGRYFISGVVAFAASATGFRSVRIVAGGTTYAAGGGIAGYTGDDNHVSFSYLVPLTSGQTIQVQAYQNSGGNLGYSSNTRINIYRTGN